MAPEGFSNVAARWAIEFAVDGDVRFLSHHDMMRLMERVVSRAGVPVRYTQGFNPHPRLSLPVPRPVGVASRREVLVADVDGPTTEAALLAALGRQMPAGVTMHTAREVAAGQPRVGAVEYELPLDDDAQAREVAQRLAAAPAQGAAGAGPTWQRLREVRLEGLRLRFVLGSGPSGPSRPADVLALLGLLATATEPTGGPEQTKLMSRLVRTGLVCEA